MIGLANRKNEGCRDDQWSDALGDGLDSFGLKSGNRKTCITDLT